MSFRRLFGATLISQKGGLTKEYNNLVDRLRIARIAGDSYSVNFLQREINNKIDEIAYVNSKLSDLGYKPKPAPSKVEVVEITAEPEYAEVEVPEYLPEEYLPPPPEEAPEEEEEEYRLIEYSKYYKYDPSEKYKKRHFEIRGTFAIPSNVDPDDADIMSRIEEQFDRVLAHLGIEVTSEWEEAMTSGPEDTGMKTNDYRENIYSVVHDLLRGYMYDYPGFATLIIMTEDELLGKK